MAHAQHAHIRDRFGARCGYCGVTEEEAGGELTIDHYVPTSAGGSEREENLVYGCIRCNLYKGDFHPNQADRTQGLVVLHPLLDAVDRHYRLDLSTGILEALTKTGCFHISLLRLIEPASSDRVSPAPTRKRIAGDKHKTFGGRKPGAKGNNSIPGDVYRTSKRPYWRLDGNLTLVRSQRCQDETGFTGGGKIDISQLYPQIGDPKTEVVSKVTALRPSHTLPRAPQDSAWLLHSADHESMLTVDPLATGSPGLHLHSDGAVRPPSF